MGRGMVALIGMLSLTAHGAETEFTGRIATDVRYRLHDVGAGAWYAPAGVSHGFERVESIVGGSLQSAGDGVIGFVDLQLVASSSRSNVGTLLDLGERTHVDPIALEVNEAFIEIWDVGTPGLDLRLGHQLVQWGVGDQFNPTNNLNADDLEDPLQFGKQLPNSMIRADYAIGPMWTLSAVGVPLFRPAMLPATSAIGMAFTDRMPVVEDEVRWQLQAEQALARDSFGLPTIVGSADIVDPADSLTGAAGMVRVGGSIGAQDLALSWYSGRSDIPQAVANHTHLEESPRCHPAEPNDCIRGYLVTESRLAFPRMHVAGLNAAGELNLLGWLGAQPLGWRVEAAWVIPEQVNIAITNDELPIDPSLIQAAGEYDYGLRGERPTVVSSEPFAKWTLGLDYTVGKHVYLNTQWVHGMPDEFGAGDFLRPGYVTRSGDGEWEVRRLRLGDYLVFGSDISLAGATLRLFSLFDLTGYHREEAGEANDVRTRTRYAPFTPNGFSAVLYPELLLRFSNGIAASVGTIQMFGASHTKFGDPAAGGDLAFVRGSYEF